MIAADPTILWTFLIALGVLALRMSKATHRVR